MAFKFGKNRNEAPQKEVDAYSEGNALAGNQSDFLFNVKAYGAKGDGKADDWHALQRVVDKAYQTHGGGTLYFPPGLYRISAPLEVPESESTVSWLGHSQNMTVIAPSRPMDYLVRMRGRGGFIQGIKFRGTDPMDGYAQYAKVCMLATDILSKRFSDAAFVWASVHGLQITGEGNNNLCVFDGLCKFNQNGMVVRGRDAKGSGETVRFSRFNPEERDVHVGAYLKIGAGEGSVYHIDSVTAGSITVSPELKEPLDAGTEYTIHIGCGLQTDRGSDNNVYGIYDCHFVGNKGAGLMVRGLYGHHVQGGNFDSNGIAGIHIGSGSINTTPAYSNTINHAYFESNGYANIILDYPAGLSILDPLLGKPRDGTSGGVASITSLRDYYFDYDSTSILYKGRLYGYARKTSASPVFEMEDISSLSIDRQGAQMPAIIKLPSAPNHKFVEEVEIYVDDSGGQPVQLVCDSANVNNKPGAAGVFAPIGEGYKITAYYNRRKNSWMVSHTTPIR